MERQIKTIFFLIACFLLLLIFFVFSYSNDNVNIGARTSTYSSAWNASSNVAYTLLNVGIGTTTPGNNLQIINSTTTPTVSIGSSMTASTTRAKLCLWNGLTFSIISFLTNATSTTISTSTSCQ